MAEIPAHVAENLNRAHVRLDKHEERIQQLELNEAGMVEWRLNTTRSLDAINSGIRWLILLILGGLGAAAINFVLAGGLNGTAQ